jgi:hypothetical protein
MFCPKCGQSQVSDEVRFCSRCGFALGVVAPLLTNHGVSHVGAPLVAAQGVSPRRKGIRQGGKLMLFGTFLIAFLAVFVELTGFPDEFPLVGVLVFLAGFLRMIYAFLFEDKTPAAVAPIHPTGQTFAPQQFDPRAQPGALPPAEFRPAPSFFAPRTDTAEIATPPSVTDHTTRLLDDQNEPRER